MLAALLQKQRNFALFNFIIEQGCISRYLALIDLIVTILGSTSTSLLTLLALYWKLSVRVTLWIIFSDIEGLHVWNLSNDRTDVVNADFTIFITLEKNQSPCLFIVMCIYGCNRYFFFNTHIIKFGHELLVALMRFKGRRCSHNPNTKSSA